MFVWGCGAGRQCRSISISKNKGLVYYLKGVSGGHLDIKIVLTMKANSWEENKVCVGVLASRQYESNSTSKNKVLLY